MAIKKINFSLNSVNSLFRDGGVSYTNIKTVSREHMDVDSMYKIEEKIKMDFKNTEISDSTTLSDFKSRMLTSVNMLSFDGQNVSPRDTEAVDNSDYGLLSYGITSAYNYYAPQYEETIVDLPENELINIYVSSRNGNNDDSKDLRHFGNTSITKESFMRSQQRNSVSYLPPNQSILNSMEIIYPQKYNFLDIAPYKAKFPFGIDISVGVDGKNKKFKNFLSKVGMYETFAQGYLSLAKQNLEMSMSFNDDALGTTSSPATIRGLDLLGLDLNSLLPVSPAPSVQYFSVEQDSAHGRALKLALLQGFMRQIALEEVASFSEIVANKSNYYEPIFYKIEKSIGDGVGQTQQTFIVPAINNMIGYFDTQVKPGQTYTYTITECALVVGSNMKVTEGFQYDTGGTSELTVEISPVLHMVEVPIIQDAVNVMCNPPTPPKMDFYTKNNFDNKIYIRMYTSGVGQVVDDYYPILPNDVDYVNALQYKNRFFGQYVYENKNNKIQRYDVMRLTKTPTSLQDFRDGVVYSVEDKVIFGGITVSSKVKPETKYYYLCRSVNQYGMVSNHSVIYEVQLIKGSSSSRLEVNSYTFKTKSEDYHFRTMTRLMQITPASEHTVYDIPPAQATLLNSDSNKRLLSKISLGQAGYPIWGEKFKIRVTSNNTGRKIDFNLDFNLIKKKTIEEIK